MGDSSFLQLHKNAGRDMSAMPEYRLAVLGDHATQLLCRAIRGCGYEQGIRFEVFDAPYDQVEAQALCADAALYRHRPQAVLLTLCTERLYESFCQTPAPARRDFASTTLARIKQLWSHIAQNSRANILQASFLELDDGVFGSFAGRTEESFFYQVKCLNLLLLDSCREADGVFPVDFNGICLRHGHSLFRDDKLLYDARLSISTRALPYAAKAAADVCAALLGRIKKCVVTDLDNTLWGGTIGDDGLSGIELGELGRGAAFVDLQRWLKELKNRGILLAVCSKNEEAAAREPFEKHPDMLLRLPDFSVFVANWHDKAMNIMEIQERLGIGLDSIVFLDDNPFERELVRGMLPSVTVPELPEDPAEYLSFLRGLNLFETVSFTEEDRRRTDQYRAEAGRASLKRQYASFDDYLQSLEMEAESAPFDAFHLPRIAQLTQRSNQFNLRTGRYTEAELERLAADARFRTLYFTLSDRFGAHGLVGVVILEARGEALFIREWLMSCRVLRRGLEEFIVNQMAATAVQGGFSRLVGEYLPTAKNAMVSDLYGRMGFSPMDEGLYRLSVHDFLPLPCFIRHTQREEP